MTQAFNLSQFANKLNSTGQISNVTDIFVSALPISEGGTNNGSLGVTSGGVIYADGSKLMTTAAGTSGYFLQSNGASAPTWAALSAGGALNNIQYFTASGTYTPTAGTNFVIVEVVGGGGGDTSGGAGGTTSFGALVSATGGGAGSTTSLVIASGGSGSSGDLNISGGSGATITGVSKSSGTISGGSCGSPYGSNNGFFVISTAGTIKVTANSYGCGASFSGSTSTAKGSGGGGGYARKKITSGFSGVTVTIGAGGTAGSNAGAAGICVVYEYK